MAREILNKGAKCQGLTYREAAVQLECEDETIKQETFRLAKEIKQKFYGNRIVLFAPLYLSNYCINGCRYCPYHGQNKHIARKQLSQEEIVREVTLFRIWGIKRLALETGEDPAAPSTMCWRASRTIYSINIKTGPSAG